VRNAQILDALSPGRLDFVQWRHIVIFSIRRYESVHMHRAESSELRFTGYERFVGLGCATSFTSCSL